MAADFKECMDRLSLRLMTNPDAAPCGVESPQGANGRKSPGSADDDTGSHNLQHLKDVEGVWWKPGMQQHCVICDAKTAWVCAECSTDASNLVPLCPQFTCPRKGANKGDRIAHDCLDKHRCRPCFFPKGAKGAGAKCRTKRVRPEATDEQEEA